MIKGILVYPSQDASCAAPLLSGKKRSAPMSPQSVHKDPFRPRLLKNLRTYYARRRPTMTPVVKAITSPSARVRFQETEQVHEVPSHRSFSVAEKFLIWTGRKELKRLLQKNHQEYAFEGRNWRTAPEEDDFVMDEHGEPQHPVHAKAIAAKKAATKPSPSQERSTRRKILRRRRLPLMSNRNTAIAVVSDSSSDSSSDEEEEPDRKRARTE